MPRLEAARSNADFVRVQRVGRLCAWWREEAKQLRAEAAKMDRMGHPRTAEKAGAGALVYETCANVLEKALKTEGAGTEPTSVLSNLESDK